MITQQEIKKVAGEIVDAIHSDLNERNGFRICGVRGSIQNEIISAHKSIILAALRPLVAERDEVKRWQTIYANEAKQLGEAYELKFKEVQQLLTERERLMVEIESIKKDMFGWTQILEDREKLRSQVEKLSGALKLARAKLVSNEMELVGTISQSSEIAAIDEVLPTPAKVEQVEGGVE